MEETENIKFRQLKKSTRVILIVLGTLSLFLGIIGIVLPVLPTTPFLLLTAGCYARSSKKFYNFLMNNRLLGTYIKNYRNGKPLPFKIKFGTILFLWITIFISIFIVNKLLITIILMIVAISVSTHIILIGKTKNKKNNSYQK